MNTEYVSDIRSFNRFYTRILGLIDRHVLATPFSLTEARVLFEIVSTKDCTANILIEKLGMDRGYMSRILKKFESDALIYKENSSDDGRAYLLYLTEKGRETFSDIDEQSSRHVEKLIGHLKDHERKKLIEAMKYIETALTADTDPVTIRSFRQEDIEHIIKKHMELYGDEYGFDHTFGEYVAETVNKFGDCHDLSMENIWIAEEAGEIVGFLAVVRFDETTAQLRWFLIEPRMRGRGLGHRLMKTALDFCREKGYKHAFLLTASMLGAARHLYARYGFTLTESVEHEIWGQCIAEERWDLQL